MSHHAVDRDRLVSLLTLSSAQHHWVLEVLDHFPPKGCYRALAMQGFRGHVQKHFGSDAQRDFDRFWQGLEITNTFGMIPAELTVLALLKIARLSGPITTSIRDALYDVANAMASDFAHNNPLMQIVYRAAGNSLVDFVKMQAQGIDNWQNFGSITVVQRGSDALDVHYDEQPYSLKEPTDRAILEGMSSLFPYRADVSSTQHSAMSYTLHLHIQ